jgi:predicted ATP-dependent serine protease
MWPVKRQPDWVGRKEELAVLRAGVETLRRGGGAAVWVEGEPGIGKSALVAEALAEMTDPGWEVGWGIADRPTERWPLRVMRDCLQVRPGSPDPRRAKAAELLRDWRLGLFSDGDAFAVGVEVLETLVDELCAAGPMVIVIDDLQWADEASLIVWHQLAASINQLRLLLIATCRLSPRRPEVQEVRGAVARRSGSHSGRCPKQVWLPW